MTVSVQHCCQAVELALKLGQADEAAALCRHVLVHYRWHLRTHLLLGQAFVEKEVWEEAVRRLRMVLAVDPECAEAYSSLGVIALAHEDLEEATRSLARAFENAPESDEVREALHRALEHRAGRPVPPPAFTSACVGRFYLRRGLPQPAAEAYATARHDDPKRDDLRLAYAMALWQAGLHEQAADLCRSALSRTPHPLVALLIAAVEQFRRGETEAGRRLWGEARAWDPDEVRARALFGERQTLPLPPKPAMVPQPQDRALAELLELSGRLVAEAPSAGQSTHELAAYAQGLVATPPSPGTTRGTSLTTAKSAPPTDPDLRHFDTTIQYVRGQIFGDPPPPADPPPQPRAGNPRPAVVILTWEEGLRTRFGAGANQVAQALQNHARAAEQHGIAGRVVYLDRPPYPEMPRPDPHDPQQIKAFLDELDRRLGEEGFDFHYLFLIGGDELIPFARLPNPTDDADQTVPSDNLYASRDPTYLIPERAVGRLPDTGPGDPAPFLEQLARCTARLGGAQPPATSPGCLGALLSWLPMLSPRRGSKAGVQRRFGLSAQVWAQASTEIFRRLPGEDPLRLCPPICRDAILPSWLEVPYAYFNLHGAADSANWYGQRDMAQPAEGPLMPVSFSPEQIPAGRVEGIVVYSEACYGANILGKNADSSISLRFLAEGCLGFVGSTVISYGVSAPPLSSADLLGQFFWQHALGGAPLGEALLQAKLDFTREMYRLQNYLDGDDMKTLLEFVLYGDPLSSLGNPVPLAESHQAGEKVAAPPVLCGKQAAVVAPHQLAGELVARVKRSLSWLQQGGEVTNLEVALRSACPGCECSGRCSSRGHTGPGPEALVFTTHRELRAEDGTILPQLARIVVDSRGHIVKMAVTR